MIEQVNGQTNKKWLASACSIRCSNERKLSWRTNLNTVNHSHTYCPSFSSHCSSNFFSARHGIRTRFQWREYELPTSFQWIQPFARFVTFNCSSVVRAAHLTSVKSTTSYKEEPTDHDTWPNSVDYGALHLGDHISTLAWRRLPKTGQATVEHCRKWVPAVQAIFRLTRIKEACTKNSKKPGKKILSWRHS